MFFFPPFFLAKVLTWNVWFKELRQGHRMAGLGDEIARVDPDVIAMQEVTPSAIVALRIQPWIKRCVSVLHCNLYSRGKVAAASDWLRRGWPEGTPSSYQDAQGSRGPMKAGVLCCPQRRVLFVA